MCCAGLGDCVHLLLGCPSSKLPNPVQPQQSTCMLNPCKDAASVTALALCCTQLCLLCSCCVESSGPEYNQCVLLVLHLCRSLQSLLLCFKAWASLSTPWGERHAWMWPLTTSQVMGACQMVRCDLHRLACSCWPGVEHTAPILSCLV